MYIFHSTLGSFRSFDHSPASPFFPLLITPFSPSPRYLEERATHAGRKLGRRAAKLRELQKTETGADGASDPAAAAASGEAAGETTATATITTTTDAASATTAPSTEAAEQPAYAKPSDPHFSRSVHGIRVLEALAASGLRSVRYYKEIPTVRSVLCNDFSADAVSSIRRNVEYNGLDAVSQVIPHEGDANAVMRAHTGGDRFAVVDLDPYGSAATFLDAAVQGVADGGLLAVTCTDMAVLAGTHTESCFARYGSMGLRAVHSHELALRILVGLVSRLASCYGRYIVPMLSCSIDFYVRVFVRVFDGAKEAKLAASRTSYVMQCTGCQAHHTFPAGRAEETPKGPKFKPGAGPRCGSQCASCGRPFVMAGPFWGDALHDTDFVAACLANVSANKSAFGTAARMEGMLSVIAEEVPDVPLYYTINGLAGQVHCITPPFDDIMCVQTVAMAWRDDAPRY